MRPSKEMVQFCADTVCKAAVARSKEVAMMEGILNRVRTARDDVESARSE